MDKVLGSLRELLSHNVKLLENNCCADVNVRGGLEV